MKIVVIVPTYQERENIALLIPAVFAQQKKTNHKLEILVVDDFSPDGTGQIVTKLQKTFPQLHLLTGAKKGLGTAYIRGMRYAMEKLNADIVVEMDADFSHKSTDLPRLLAQIDKGADFVIGSRYVQGGKLPKDWSLIRKANSSWGNRFARRVAGIKNVRDCTAGFRAIRTDLLKRIDLGNMKVNGYSFQIKLLYEAIKAEGIVKEIPVEFVERKFGSSKIGLRDIIEFFGTAFQLGLRGLK